MRLGFSLLVPFGLTRFVPHLGVIAWVFQWSDLICIRNIMLGTLTIAHIRPTINNKACVWERGHTHTSCAVIWSFSADRHQPPSIYQNQPRCFRGSPALTFDLEDVDMTTPLEWRRHQHLLHAQKGSNSDKRSPSGTDESFVLLPHFTRASIMLGWCRRLESHRQMA